MKKMGIPIDARKQRMIMDGFDEKEANTYLGIETKAIVAAPVASESDANIMTPEKLAMFEAEFNKKHEAAKNDEKFASYVRMQKMRIPDGAVRNKMIKVRTRIIICIIAQRKPKNKGSALY